MLKIPPHFRAARRFLLLSILIVLNVSQAAAAKSSFACPDVSQLQEERSQNLSNLIDDLTSQLPDASEEQRQTLEKQIQFLGTRLHLLDVAYQRLNKDNLNAQKCEAIEAFILRFSSVS